MNAVYHAVRMNYLEPDIHFVDNIWQWGHSMAVDPMSVYCTLLPEGHTDYTRGVVLSEAEEGEEILYADISK